MLVKKRVQVNLKNNKNTFVFYYKKSLLVLINKDFFLGSFIKSPRQVRSFHALKILMLSVCYNFHKLLYAELEQ